MNALGQEILQPDRDEIIQALQVALVDEVEKTVSRPPFDLGRLVRTDIDVFLTERHNQLAVGFEFEYEARNVVTSELRLIPNAILEVGGSATFNLDSKNASDVQLTATQLIGPDGQGLATTIFRTPYLSVSDSIGIRQLRYTLRRKLAV